MVVRRRDAVLLASLGLLIAWSKPGALQAVEAPLELQWHQLVPPAPPKPPKSFLSGRGPVDIGKLGGPDDGSPAPPPQSEGRWMSTPSRTSATPPLVVDSFGGKRVHIGGYVVPLNFDSTSGHGLPAGAVRRSLHPRAASPGQPDHLCEGRAGLRREGNLRSSVGYWHTQGHAHLHRPGRCRLQPRRREGGAAPRWLTRGRCTCRSHPGALSAA